MRATLGIVAALFSVISAEAQVQSPADVDSGRIAGHVVTAYAELMKDATVTLVRMSDQKAGFQRTTRTDDTGAFSFTQLPDGHYQLMAASQGYTSRQLPAAGSTSVLTFDIGPSVDLAENGEALDLQIVLYRTATIAGRIIRPDGSAAADVQVQAATRTDYGRFPLMQARTVSQSDGRYEITGLPPGEYLIGAMNVAMPTRQGFDAARVDPAERQANAATAVAAAASAHWSWYPGVADSEPGTAVTLLEGVNAEGIDVWLTPSQRFSVSGRVFWPVGISVESITIDYGDPEGTSSGLWVVSDPGGLFTLSGIAPGPLTLLARADSDQGPLIGMASTEVTVDSVEDVRIVVDRPGVLAGRIVYEGKVASNARATSIIAVQKLLKTSALYPVPESVIGPAGRFELPGTVGEYEFSLDGLASGLAIKRVTRNGGTLPMNRIGVAAGETIDDIEIVVGQ